MQIEHRLNYFNGTGKSLQLQPWNVSAVETMNLVCKHKQHVVVNVQTTVSTGYEEPLRYPLPLSLSLFTLVYLIVANYANLRNYARLMQYVCTVYPRDTFLQILLHFDFALYACAARVNCRGKKRARRSFVFRRQCIRKIQIQIESSSNNNNYKQNATDCWAIE